MTFIPSSEWARRYKLKVTRLDHLRRGFLKSKVTELANKHIVDPIIEMMKLHGVARVIQESVVVAYVNVTYDGIVIRIKSEYFSEEGFDVALAREKGTEDHMIRPVVANALRWMGPNGKFLFSGGHMVSGLPRLNLIERGIEKGEVDLVEELNSESRKWKHEVLGM